MSSRRTDGLFPSVCLLEGGTLSIRSPGGFHRVSLARIPHVAVPNVIPGRRNVIVGIDRGKLEFTLDLRSITFPEGNEIIKFRVLLSKKKGKNGCGRLTSNSIQKCSSLRQSLNASLKGKFSNI